MKIVIAGLGLMGGSMAKTIKLYTKHKVGAIDLSPAVVDRAIKDGAIDFYAEDCSDADIIIVALYPDDAIRFIKRKLPVVKEGAIFVDLCGVKRHVCDAVRTDFESRTDCYFVGAHPMAGKERSGFDHSSADLFRGSSMILTPESNSNAGCEHILTALFTEIGFGEVIITTPEDHDRIIAFTSQLAHVVSSAYVKSPTASEHMGFSAGSFRDLTRVARLNEVMWAELFIENADFLAAEIDTIIKNLADYRDAIAHKDDQKLKALLAEGRQRKEWLEEHLG